MPSDVQLHGILTWTPVLCSQLIETCRKALDHGRKKDPYPNITPQLAVLRQDSRKRWHTTWDSLRAVTRRHTISYRMVSHSWLALKATLEIERFEQLDRESVRDERAFPPFTMCNWKNCLCSVHEPVHKLKICKRCRRVAYCNTRCQEKYVLFPLNNEQERLSTPFSRDWTDGSHKSQCRRIRS